MTDAPAPKAQFTKTRDGVRIAYTKHGQGPFLVYVRGLNSHCERWWTGGWHSRLLSVLAQAFTVVLYDARGNGLSDDARGIDLGALLDDLDAVIEDADLREITLFGQGFGAPVAIAYAARHPERINRLLLYCAYATGRHVVITDTFIETMRSMPQAATAFMTRETYPDDEDLPTRLFTMDSMHALSSDAAVAHLEFARTVDVSSDVPNVQVPTLVIQPQRNPQVAYELGREIADRIPDAVIEKIPGGSYNPWAPKSAEPTLRAIGRFVGIDLASIPRPVVLLLTDMVDSTAMTQRLGETVSRYLHALHDSVVRSEVDRCKGTLMKHTGDGIMAAFSSASDAIACATAIQQQLAERNRDSVEPLEVRVGLAQGDVYAHTGEPFASSAQLVTRVASRGSAGDILTTDPVRDLAPPGEFEFGNSRSVGLKGFPGRVRLHEVVWGSQSEPQPGTV